MASDAMCAGSTPVRRTSGSPRERFRASLLVERDLFSANI